MSKRPIPLTAEQAKRRAKEARVKALAGFDPLKLLNGLIEDNSASGLNHAFVGVRGAGEWTEEAKELADEAARALVKRGFTVAQEKAGITVSW